MTCFVQRTKSPGEQVGLRQDGLQPRPRSPPVGGPREADVGLAQARRAVLIARRRRAAPTAAVISASAALARPPGMRGGSTSSDCRDSYTSAETHAASSGGDSPSHTPSRRHSRREQVQLGVQPGELTTRRRDLVAGEVAQLLQDTADPVEGAGDGVRPRAHPALQVVGLAAQSPVPLGPARVLLAIGAAVTRVVANALHAAG